MKILDQGTETVYKGSRTGPNARLKDLKGRVTAIKEAHFPDILDDSVEAEELVKERIKYQYAQNELESQNAELKSHLTSVIDRTTKIRNAYEKEKKLLLNQVQKLEANNDRFREQFESSKKQLMSSHAAEISEKTAEIRLLSERYEDLVRQRDSHKAESAAKQMKLYEQYREWLKDAKQEHNDALERELDVRQSLRQELEKSHQKYQQLRKELDSEKEHSASLSAQLKNSAFQMSKQQDEFISLREIIQKLETQLLKEKEERRIESQQTASSADERLEQYKRSHADEIDQIQAKLRSVLQRKNETVHRLQTSLDKAESRVAAYEEEFRQEKMRVLEQMQW